MRDFINHAKILDVTKIKPILRGKRKMKLSTGMKKALSMFLTAALVVSGVYVSDGKASAKEQVLAVTAGTTNSIKVETNVKVATSAEITFVKPSTFAGVELTGAATNGVVAIAKAATNAATAEYIVDVYAS